MNLFDKVIVATHDGRYHLDELVAISLLMLASNEPSDEGSTSVWDEVEVIRTRDEEELAKAKKLSKNVKYTKLNYNDRNTLIINDCDKVICPDYGNGTVDAIWKAIKQNKPIYTTGKYIVGKFVKSVPKLIQVA